MNVIYSLLPIILLILLAGFIIFQTKRNSKKKKRYLSGQKIRFMFGVYLVVLLISVGLFFLIPDEGKISEPKVNHNFHYMYDKVMDGHVSAIDQDRITKQWHFDYDGDELMMKAANNDMNGISIFVEKKKENDGKIDVLFYQTPTYVEGIDVTDQVKPPLVDLSSGALSVAKPRLQELKFTSFKQEFSISQFTGEDWFRMGDTFIRGDHLLYIRVPNDLKIHQDHYIGVQYIKE